MEGTGLVESLRGQLKFENARVPDQTLPFQWSGPCHALPAANPGLDKAAGGDVSRESDEQDLGVSSSK